MTRAAVAAELRAVAWGPVAAVTTAALALLALDVSVWPHGPGAVTAWLGAALLAGAAAFALDQPAAGAVESVPTSRAARTLVRSVPGLVALSLWIGYAVLWRSRVSVQVPSWGAQSLVGLGLVGLGLGLCTVLVRRGQSEPAALVAGGLVLGILALGVVPMPGDVQVLDLSGSKGSTTALWWGVVVWGAVGLVWGSRDEGSRWRRAPARPTTH